MNSITRNFWQKSIRASPRFLQFVLLLLVFISLVACAPRVIQYKGTCAEQTEQFLDYIHTLVIGEFTPVIEDGFNLQLSSQETIKRIEELETKLSELNIPKCNKATQAVKDALLQYMLEARLFFTIMTARSIYGDVIVQLQLTKMNQAGLAFERAFEDLRK